MNRRVFLNGLVAAPLVMKVSNHGENAWRVIEVSYPNDISITFPDYGPPVHRVDGEVVDQATYQQAWQRLLEPRF